MDPDGLLRIAEYFLRQRSFGDCHKYAIQAQEHHSHRHSAAQILAVSAVLSASESPISTATQPDWYSILQVSRLSQDSKIIETQFTNLLLLLNPNRNKYPFAPQAFQLVREAWFVLSNPSKRLQFDNELKAMCPEGSVQRLASGNYGEDKQKPDVGCEGMSEHCGGTFWTVCPYCYYLYEYAKVYEDCCLRCINDMCGRGFHAVAIAAPSTEAVESGRYWCYGFFPIGYQAVQGKFAFPMQLRSPLDRNAVGKGKNGACKGGYTEKGDCFIDISDDSDSDDLCEKFGSERKGTFGDSDDQGVEKCERENVDESRGGGGCVRSHQAEVSNGEKSGVKRMKKVVGKGSEKLMANRPGK